MASDRSAAWGTAMPQSAWKRPSEARGEAHTRSRTEAGAGLTRPCGSRREGRDATAERAPGPRGP